MAGNKQKNEIISEGGGVGTSLKISTEFGNGNSLIFRECKWGSNYNKSNLGTTVEVKKHQEDLTIPQTGDNDHSLDK